MLALSRTRTSIRRLRLEYAILLERLEDRVYYQTADDVDLIPRQDLPVLLDETLNLRSTKLGNLRYAGDKNDKSSRSTARRAVKDPAMPKRPGSAYFFYCEQEREHLRVEFEAAHPGAPTTEFTKHLVEKWKHLPADQKAPFLKSHEEDKHRYATEMEAYNEKKAEEAGEANDGEAGEGAEGGEEENDDHVDTEMSSRQPTEALEESASVPEPVVKIEAVDKAETAETTKKDETEGMTEKPANDTEAKAPVPAEPKSVAPPSDSLPGDDSGQPPAKRAKVEATRTVSLGANGHPKFTIKIRSPTAPHP